MARRYSDTAQRVAWMQETGLVMAGGSPITVYADASGTPANIAAYDPETPDAPGEPIASDSLRVDTSSLVPAFWDLDDLDSVFVSADGGPVVPYYPDTQPQITDLSARIGTLDAGLSGQIADRVSKGELTVNVADYGAAGDGVTNDTPAINAAIAAAPAGGTVLLSGEHRLTGAVIMRAGVTLDGRRGSLRQTTNLAPCVVVDNAPGARLHSVRMRGVGTDYVNSSSVYLAAGVSVSNGSSGVSIVGCSITNVAGGGVLIGSATCTDVTIADCTLSGPDADLITPVTSGFGGGVVVNAQGIRRLRITGNSISRFAQGIVTGTSHDLVIANNIVHDIIGQHGIYLDATQGLTVTGNVIRDVALQGIKVQIAHPDFETAGVAISGNVITDCGSHAVLVTNVLTGDGAALRSRDVVITGNSMQPAGDGVRAILCDGLIVSDNLVRGGLVGVGVEKSTAWSVIGNRVAGVQSQGVYVNDSGDGTLALNRVANPAQQDTAATEFGIMLAGANTTDVLITGNTVTDSTAKMKYALYLVAGVAQDKVSVRDNSLTGATDYAARLDPSKLLAEWRDNVLQGGIGQVVGYPTVSPIRGATPHYRGTGAPTAGAWVRGDFVWNNAPASPGTLGWVCTVAGTPGTWAAVPIA